MKTIITSFLLLLSVNTYASYNHNITCELDSKRGPLKDFTASFESDSHHYFGQISKVNYIQTNWDKSIGIDEIQVVNDNFAVRIRNLIRSDDTDNSFQDPKRVYILCTEGVQDFIFDDGDIDELDKFGDVSPYRAPIFKGYEGL